MINDGILTYPGAGTGFKWQPESELLYAFLLAALSTIIVYQTTSIVFDLVLGLKKKGTVKVSLVGSLLLAEESSLISSFVSLFPKSRLANFKFHGSKSNPFDCSLHSKSISSQALIAFLILLVASPLINIAGVILTVESDTIASFQDAAFGGIAVGLNKNAPSRDAVRICTPHKKWYSNLEYPLAEVYTCIHATSDEKPSNFPSGVTGSLTISKNVDVEGPLDSIVIEFKNETFAHKLFFHVDISVARATYRVKSLITMNDGANLIQSGERHVLRNCNSGNLFPRDIPRTVELHRTSPKNGLCAKISHVKSTRKS